MSATIKLRRGSAADWTLANPILLAGEIGLETDTGKFKIGSGFHVWTALPYYLNEPTTTALIHTLIDAAVLTGVPGPKGDKGDPGDTGPKGDTGATGPKGDTGNTGATGSVGSTGATGPKGDKGDTGDAGAKGDKGDQGNPGTNGTSYTGPPLTASVIEPVSPAIGDLWVDLSA
jgi:hypothetical protein